MKLPPSGEEADTKHRTASNSCSCVSLQNKKACHANVFKNLVLHRNLLLCGCLEYAALSVVSRQLLSHRQAKRLYGYTPFFVTTGYK